MTCLPSGDSPFHFQPSRLAGVRVRELAVAVVRERHVARAAVVELLHAREAGAERIAVLDADERDLPAARGDAADVGRGERQADLVGRDCLGEAVHGVELLDRRLVGALVAARLEGIRRGLQRRLADVDDQEDGVEAAVDHLRQVDLGLEPLRVVAFGREAGRVDVDVCIERDRLVVDGARLLDQVVVGALPPARCRRRDHERHCDCTEHSPRCHSSSAQPVTGKCIEADARLRGRIRGGRGFGVYCGIEEWRISLPLEPANSPNPPSPRTRDLLDF